MKYRSAKTLICVAALVAALVATLGPLAAAKWGTVTGRYTDVFIKEGTRWLFITWAGGDDPKK